MENILNKFNIKWMYLFLILSLNTCEDFIDIDTPNNQLTGKEIFDTPTTINAALAGVYGQLRENSIVSGGSDGATYLMGLYADELVYYNASIFEIQAFYENNLLPSNNTVSNLWNTSYNLIYSTNAIIEGINNSESLIIEEKNKYLGEAYFLRGFIHFYLTNLFGDIPYINSTDYTTNLDISKLNQETVYDSIIIDMFQAKSLLTAEITGNNTRPNKWAASALLSRIYLYKENWELASTEAIDIIENGPYILNSDLAQVFLNTSPETLWQLDPGSSGANTVEALTYIFNEGPPPNVALSQELINSFESDDLRLNEWIGTVTDSINEWYYPFKYKLNTNTGNTQENSILLRLAEMYLIAAEANAKLGNNEEALNYLNSIRTRAGLSEVNLSGSEDILNAIYHERRVELFVEQAHRWFDLKRTNRATQQLSPIKANWNDTDILLPIPESELLINPNLEPQNAGY